MKKWILLIALLSPAIARANTVTPQFTTESMSTTTTSQTITEEIVHDVKGAAVETYTGTNITVGGTGGIGSDSATYTPSQRNKLGFINNNKGSRNNRTITIDRTIETESTTNSYSSLHNRYACIC